MENPTQLISLQSCEGRGKPKSSASCHAPMVSLKTRRRREGKALSFDGREVAKGVMPEEKGK